MLTYDQETKEPKELIDFTGFENVSVMANDECTINTNFKVNTSRGHYYFYAETKPERTKWLDCILAMMTAHAGDSDVTSINRTGSVRSIASTIRTQ